MSYVVSYGAGVDSTAMTILLLQQKKPIDHVVFADTGGEMPETYEYLEVMANFLKQYSIPFTVVHPPKLIGLYERCLRRRVIPSQLWRWCTRDVKVKPIHKFYKKTIGGFINQYLGIDYGETRRAKESKEPFIKNLYPLIESKLDRDGCIDIIKKEGLPVPIKSGCYFCPFNNPKRWKQIQKDHPLLFQKAMKLEQQSKFFPKQTLSKLPLSQIEFVEDNDDRVLCGSGYV